MKQKNTERHKRLREIVVLLYNNNEIRIRIVEHNNVYILRLTCSPLEFFVDLQVLGEVHRLCKRAKCINEV